MRRQSVARSALWLRPTGYPLLTRFRQLPGKAASHSACLSHGWSQRLTHPLPQVVPIPQATLYVSTACGSGRVEPVRPREVTGGAHCRMDSRAEIMRMTFVWIFPATVPSGAIRSLAACKRCFSRGEETYPDWIRFLSLAVATHATKSLASPRQARPEIQNPAVSNKKGALASPLVVKTPTTQIRKRTSIQTECFSGR